jgi:hypothetical protein
VPAVGATSARPVVTDVAPIGHVDPELGQQHRGHVLDAVGKIACGRGDPAYGADREGPDRDERFGAQTSARPGAVVCPCTDWQSQLGPEQSHGLALACELGVGGRCPDSRQHRHHRRVPSWHGLALVSVEELIDECVIQGERIVVEPRRQVIEHPTFISDPAVHAVTPSASC